MKDTYISIVSPVYKGESMIAELVERITASLAPITDRYEILLVNDASPDRSWDRIVELCSKDHRVKGINLSRNFGQHYAISAGLSECKGEWVVVMDCDLQDKPEEIPRLIKKAQEGFDIVYARRAKRNDSFTKRLSSSMFHACYSWLSGLDTDKAIANFGIYNHRVIEEFNKMPEMARSFPSLVRYLGFNSSAIDVVHGERKEGKSSYTLSKSLKLSLDVIISNSNKPLRLAVGIGFVMAVVSFALALYNLVAKWIGIIRVQGFTTTVFSIWFVGGLLLFVIGVLGLYIGKIFDQVKGRQIFIIKERVNID